MSQSHDRGHRPGRRAFHRAALATLAAPLFVRAQRGGSDDSPNHALYMEQGADRDARLLAGARQEGQVTIYTSLNTKDSVPITEAFEKKTGVKVELWRASSEKVLQRSVTEARAGHYTPDRFNFFTIGYNTNLVKPAEVPKAYLELIEPRWDGRVGLEASDVDWFGAMVKYMGEARGLAFFRKLAQSHLQIRTGHTLMAELVASGEIPLVASIYNHAIERLKVKGAPVEWKAIEPTFGRPNAIGVARHAQHPHAGLLFADFMLSPEGQELIKKRHRVPASLAVQTPLNKFPFHMIDPVITLDENDKWEKLWSGMFL